MNPVKVAIGCDHAAIEFKNELVSWLNENGFEAVDCGIQIGEKIDYPEMAAIVCQKVRSGECEKGILCCGTGVGMSMAANKVHGIRAALCSDFYSAKYTRLHNDANVACFGARVLGIELAKELLHVFLTTPFEGGRHQRRVDLMRKMEDPSFRLPD